MPLSLDRLLVNYQRIPFLDELRDDMMKDFIAHALAIGFTHPFTRSEHGKAYGVANRSGISVLNEFQDMRFAPWFSTKDGFGLCDLWPLIHELIDSYLFVPTDWQPDEPNRPKEKFISSQDLRILYRSGLAVIGIQTKSTIGDATGVVRFASNPGDHSHGVFSMLPFIGSRVLVPNYCLYFQHLSNAKSVGVLTGNVQWIGHAVDTNCGRLVRVGNQP